MINITTQGHPIDQLKNAGDFGEVMEIAISAYRFEMRRFGEDDPHEDDVEFWAKSIQEATLLKERWQAAQEEVQKAQKQIMAKHLAQLQQDHPELEINVELLQGDWWADVEF